MNPLDQLAPLIDPEPISGGRRHPAGGCGLALLLGLAALWRFRHRLVKRKPRVRPEPVLDPQRRKRWRNWPACTNPMAASPPASGCSS